MGSAYSAATDPERSFGLSICHAPRALGRPVRGEQRTRWPQPRQFDYSGTEPWRGVRSVQMSFSVGTRVARGVASSAPFASELLQMVLACYAS